RSIGTWGAARGVVLPDADRPALRLHHRPRLALDFRGHTTFVRNAAPGWTWRELWRRVGAGQRTRRLEHSRLSWSAGDFNRRLHPGAHRRGIRRLAGTHTARSWPHGQRG